MFSNPRWLVGGIAAAFLAIGIAWTTHAVIRVEATELDRIGPRRSITEGTRSQELVSAELNAGEDVSFEACASDGFREEVWRDTASFAVVFGEERELVHRFLVDAPGLALVRRGPEAGCVTVAQGTAIPVGGLYRLVLEWSDTNPAQLRPIATWGRVSAIPHRPAGLALLAWPLVFFAIGGLTMGLAWCIRGRRPPPREKRIVVSSSRSWRVVGLGLSLFAAAYLATSVIPLDGSLGLLVRGYWLAAIEVALVVVLGGWLSQSRADALALFPPLRIRVWVFAAFVVGFLLRGAGMGLARWLPATGQAPIEAAVFWPSGMLAVAAIGLLAPIAEELFFRGLVYRGLEATLGPGITVVSIALIFALPHLLQTYGAWGAFSAIAITGVTLTWMRHASGSIVPGLVAHLTHNALAIPWFG